MFVYILTAEDGVKPDRVGETRPAFPIRSIGTQEEIIVFLSPSDAHDDTDHFFRLVDAPTFTVEPSDPAI